MNPVIRKLHEAQLRKDLPEFRAGDTVKVNVRLLEGEGEKVKERIQTFEGVVISKKGRASSASFTVRRVSFGTGFTVIPVKIAPSTDLVFPASSDRHTSLPSTGAVIASEADPGPPPQ